MAYSPWGHKKSDMTERLTCSFSLFIFLFYLQRHDSCLQEADGRFEVKIIFLRRQRAKACDVWYILRDFRGGPGVKNWSCNAGDVGSILGWGTKIPHTLSQLRPCTTTTEPMSLNEDPAWCT